MRRRWITVAAGWMAVVMLLVACSPKDGSSTGGAVPGDDLTAIPVEEVLFALNQLSQEEVEALTASDTLMDLMLASPFYLSEATEGLFQDKRYFDAHRQQVKALLERSGTFEFDVSLIQVQNDYLQGVVLSVAQELAAEDPDIEMYYYPMLFEYRDMNASLSLLKSEIEALKTPAANDYTQAWQDYLLIQKKIALAQETLLMMTRLTQDALLLQEEVAPRVAEGMFKSGDMENLDTVLEILPGFEYGFDAILLEMDYYLNVQEALKRSDAYLSLAMTEAMEKASESMGNSLAAAAPQGEVTAEMLTLAREANRLHQESAREWKRALSSDESLMPVDALRQQLSERMEHTGQSVAQVEAKGGEIAEGRIAASQDLSTFRTLPTLWLVAAADTTDIAGMSDAQVLYEQAVAEAQASEIKRVIPEELPEKPGFFQRMKQKVTNVTGRILERANTVTYNYFFEDYAAEIGVDAKEIAAEKQRVREEEARRIRDGEAGSAVINQAIGWMEAQEQKVVDWVGSGVGDDENLIWVTKAAAKYGLGKFTDGSKGILRLMDPKATNAQLSKAVLDIAGTVFDFTKRIDIAMDITSNFVDEGNQQFLAEALEERLAPKSAETAVEIANRQEEAYEGAEGAFQELFPESVQRYSPIVVETVSRLQEVIEEDRQQQAAMKDTTGQEMADAGDEMPGGEDQGAEGAVEEAPYEEDQGMEEDQGVADTGQTGSNDQINTNTVDLKKGTYNGHYVLVETDLGTIGESEARTVSVKVTVRENQVIIDHTNSSEETLTFTIEQTDMAGRIKGRGYASPDFIIRPDLGPTGQHLLLLEFHAGASGEAKGKIWMHYVNQRIGYLEFVATKN